MPTISKDIHTDSQLQTGKTRKTALLGRVRLASIVGLIALAGQRLTAQDVQGVEAELVQNLADTMKSVKEYEERVSVNREEINRLEQERWEIELIVRQASLKIFMEERLRNLAAEVEKRVNADSDAVRSAGQLSRNNQAGIGIRW